MEIQKTMKKIGIVGGAGPQAGILLVENIIRLYQQQGCWQDHEFPSIMLLSNNFSPMLDQDHHHALIVQEVQEAIDRLDAAGNESVAIACNTLHAFVQTIDFKSMDFISIVDTVINVLKYKQYQKVLFLGTQTSVQNKIYEICDTIQIIYPTEVQQGLVHDCIVRILKHHYTKHDSELMSKIIDEALCNEKVDAVILGCTELSIIHQMHPIISTHGIEIIDPLALLAKTLAQ
jgi:aspartate racemase